MLKKLVFAVFGLLIFVGLASPPKADAQVAFGVQIGAPAVVFQSGYHEGYYYENGYRYQRDSRGYRHYDHAYGGHQTTTGKMTAPTGTETIMTSITRMATIATGRNNGDHNNNHDHWD